MEANKHEASASSADQRLGTAPLTPLIFKLALPTALAQLVNMLYNIVDRIYVGHIPETGSLALAGLGVAVEGGSPAALAAADRTCPSAAREGVADLCRELWPAAFAGAE